MRILHVITRLILGGAQQNTVLSCAAQVGAGHQVWLAYGPIYGPEGSLLKEAVQSGAKLVRIAGMRRAIMPIHDLRCYLALRRIIRKVQPDVVHTHSSKAGVLGRAAAWHEKVPAVIHTIHGLPFHARQTALERNLYIASERWAARHCHRLIGVTQAMCDAFGAQRIAQPEQFEVVPSGVDVALFEQPTASRQATLRAYGIEPDVPVIGIVARLDKFKGHDDLLDLMPILLQHHPDLRLIFVGDGYYREALEDRIGREQLQDRVIFAGLIPFRQVSWLYHAMDMMVLPSSQEGQSRTLVEALLCRCPIVGYDVGGIGEICLDGKTGRLVQWGDKKALGEAILWMLDHPHERSQLIEQGAEHARKHFGLDAMVRRLDEIYTDTLDTR